MHMPDLNRASLDKYIRSVGVRQFRLACGLVLFAYLLSHFINHALGNISGSSWNRVGKSEGLNGRKARYFRDLLHFCRVQNLAQMLDGKDIETSSAALGYVFI